MNNDLISREALKKELHNFFDGKVIDEPAYILRDVFCYIDNAPTVKIDTNGIEYKAYCKGLEDGKKIARPQGEWQLISEGNRLIGEGNRHECNRCKEYAPSFKDGSEHLSNFCPNCGAKMDNSAK